MSHSRGSLVERRLSWRPCRLEERESLSRTARRFDRVSPFDAGLRRPRARRPDGRGGLARLRRNRRSRTRRGSCPWPGLGWSNTRTRSQSRGRPSGTWAAEAGAQNGLTLSKGSLCISLESCRCPHSEVSEAHTSWDPLGDHLSSRSLEGCVCLETFVIATKHSRAEKVTVEAPLCGPVPGRPAMSAGHVVGASSSSVTSTSREKTDGSSNPSRNRAQSHFVS